MVCDMFLLPIIVYIPPLPYPLTYTTQMGITCNEEMYTLTYCYYRLYSSPLSLFACAFVCSFSENACHSLDKRNCRFRIDYVSFRHL